ncbi:hypothetical protein SAMN05444267_10866, partial [Chryseobacterium polytrichastri]
MLYTRNTSGSKQHPDDAHEVMKWANKFSTQLEGIFNKWAKLEINDHEAQLSKKFFILRACLKIVNKKRVRAKSLIKIVILELQNKKRQ